MNIWYIKNIEEKNLEMMFDGRIQSFYSYSIQKDKNTHNWYTLFGI